jgi:hypothetical protein
LSASPSCRKPVLEHRPSAGSLLLQCFRLADVGAACVLQVHRRASPPPCCKSTVGRRRLCYKGSNGAAMSVFSGDGVGSGACRGMRCCCGKNAGGELQAEVAVTGAASYRQRGLAPWLRSITPSRQFSGMWVLFSVVCSVRGVVLEDTCHELESEAQRKISSGGLSVLPFEHASCSPPPLPTANTTGLGMHD